MRFSQFDKFDIAVFSAGGSTLGCRAARRGEGRAAPPSDGIPSSGREVERDEDLLQWLPFELLGVT